MQPSTADFTGLLTGTQTICEDHTLTDKAEEIADHVRCGKFEDIVKKANKFQADEDAAKAEYLCITGKDGTISRERDFQRLKNVQNAMREDKARTEMNATKDDILLSDARVACDALQGNSAYSSTLDQPNDGEDELEYLRRKRMAQMRREKQMREHWRSLGHGKLSLIQSEIEFFQQVKPHERAIVAIHDQGDVKSSLKNEDSFLTYLAKLAEKHLETGMFHLYQEKARFLLSMLELPDGGLPVLFILRHGEVICRVGRALLMDEKMGFFSFEKLLKSRDAFGEGASAAGGQDESSSDDDDKSGEEDTRGHRKKLTFQRF